MKSLVHFTKVLLVFSIILGAVEPVMAQSYNSRHRERERREEERSRRAYREQQERERRDQERSLEAYREQQDRERRNEERELEAYREQQERERRNEERELEAYREQQERERRNEERELQAYREQQERERYQESYYYEQRRSLKRDLAVAVIGKLLSKRKKHKHSDQSSANEFLNNELNKLDGTKQSNFKAGVAMAFNNSNATLTDVYNINNSAIVLEGSGFKAIVDLENPQNTVAVGD